MFNPPMNRSGTDPFVKPKVPLKLKLLVSGLRNVRRSEDDGEESEHLVVQEYPALLSLHHPPSQSRLKVKSLTTPDLDDVHLQWRYAQMAQDILSSLPFTCPWLGPKDVNPVGEHPIAAGGFTDVYEATYDGRRVILKSYRLYVSFDVAQVIAVCCNHSLCQADC